MYSTPNIWDNPIDKVIIGPELLRESNEKVVNIDQNLKIAQMCKRVIYTKEEQ